MRIWQNSFWYKFLKAIGGIAVVAAVVYLVWQAFGQMLPDLIPLLKEGNSVLVRNYLKKY